MQRRLCNRCNQCGETAEPCTCTEDLIEADQDVADLKQQLAEAEQRAEKVEKDLAAAMVEVAEILHNRQAKIEAFKTAERNAVRECERIASRHIANAQHVAYQIRNRYPQLRGGVMTPNKEALFGLSFSIAVAEALMAQEPAKHSRRHRQLEKVVKTCMETLDCYPGELDAAYMDHAAKVFDTLQAQTIAGPHG